MASAKPKKKNPRLASGRKRVRQDVKLNAANTSLRSKYRTAVKNVEKAVAAGDKAKATELFAKACKRCRHRRRQGHLPQEQGRPRQEPPVRQGEGPGHRRRLTHQANSPGRFSGPPFETGALPAK
jgi:ribosomal protein S20